MGLALKKLNRIEEAIKSFDKALEIKPGYEAAWRAKEDLSKNN
jgi:tetratricopeptide (TPR) repeat protein